MKRRRLSGGDEFSVRDNAIASEGLDTGGRQPGVWSGLYKGHIIFKKTPTEAKFCLVQDCIIASLLDCRGLLVLKTGNETRGQELFFMSLRK